MMQPKKVTDPPETLADTARKILYHRAFPQKPIANKTLFDPRTGKLLASQHERPRIRHRRTTPPPTVEEDLDNLLGGIIDADETVARGPALDDHVLSPQVTPSPTPSVTREPSPAPQLAETTARETVSKKKNPGSRPLKSRATGTSSAKKKTTAKAVGKAPPPKRRGRPPPDNRPVDDGDAPKEKKKRATKKQIPDPNHPEMSELRAAGGFAVDEDVFEALVQEIFKNIVSEDTGSNPAREPPENIEASAVTALQHVCEQLIADVTLAAGESAAHAGRVTVKKEDMVLAFKHARQLRGYENIVDEKLTEWGIDHSRPGLVKGKGLQKTIKERQRVIEDDHDDEDDETFIGTGSVASDSGDDEPVVEDEE